MMLQLHKFCITHVSLATKAMTLIPAELVLY